jgi:hypothetical protein
MRRVFAPSAYVVLVAAALGLLLLNVFAWGGGLVDEPAAKQSQPEPTPEPAPLPPPPPPPAEPRTVANPPAAATSPAATTSLTISATRGDCWVEVRAGSPTGELLYAGTLAAGNTLRFNRERLWLRLGAAANVDVTVNGRPSTVPPGTVELVLPA